MPPNGSRWAVEAVEEQFRPPRGPVSIKLKAAKEDLMIFARNADTGPLAIRSVEGKAIAGTLMVKPLIEGEENEPDGNSA